MTSVSTRVAAGPSTLAVMMTRPVPAAPVVNGTSTLWNWPSGRLRTLGDGVPTVAIEPDRVTLKAHDEFELQSTFLAENLAVPELL
jgi:hypothetical protein